MEKLANSLMKSIASLFLEEVIWFCDGDGSIIVTQDVSKLTQDVSKWLKMPQRRYARTAYNYQSGNSNGLACAAAVRAF
jgi:hypothetical protein